MDVECTASCREPWMRLHSCVHLSRHERLWWVACRESRRTSGAAALLLCTASFVRTHELRPHVRRPRCGQNTHDLTGIPRSRRDSIHHVAVIENSKKKDQIEASPKEISPSHGFEPVKHLLYLLPSHRYHHLPPLPLPSPSSTKKRTPRQKENLLSCLGESSLLRFSSPGEGVRG